MTVDSGLHFGPPCISDNIVINLAGNLISFLYKNAEYLEKDAGRFADGFKWSVAKDINEAEV